MVLIKAVFLVIKLYLLLNYVVNKPSTPAFWLEHHCLLTGTWRVAGWQGRWGEQAKQPHLVISSVDTRVATCGRVACPTGQAGVSPAVKGLLSGTLGLPSSEDLRSGLSL